MRNQTGSQLLAQFRYRECENAFETLVDRYMPGVFVALALKVDEPNSEEASISLTTIHIFASLLKFAARASKRTKLREFTSTDLGVVRLIFRINYSKEYLYMKKGDKMIVTAIGLILLCIAAGAQGYQRKIDTHPSDSLTPLQMPSCTPSPTPPGE